MVRLVLAALSAAVAAAQQPTPEASAANTEWCLSLCQGLGDCGCSCDNPASWGNLLQHCSEADVNDAMMSVCGYGSSVTADLVSTLWDSWDFDWTERPPFWVPRTEDQYCESVFLGAGSGNTCADIAISGDQCHKQVSGIVPPSRGGSGGTWRWAQLSQTAPYLAAHDINEFECSASSSSASHGSYNSYMYYYGSSFDSYNSYMYYYGSYFGTTGGAAESGSSYGRVAGGASGSYGIGIATTSADYGSGRDIDEINACCSDTRQARPSPSAWGSPSAREWEYVGHKELLDHPDAQHRYLSAFDELAYCCGIPEDAWEPCDTRPYRLLVTVLFGGVECTDCESGHIPPQQLVLAPTELVLLKLALAASSDDLVDSTSIVEVVMGTLDGDQVEATFTVSQAAGFVAAKSDEHLAYLLASALSDAIDRGRSLFEHAAFENTAFANAYPIEADAQVRGPPLPPAPAAEVMLPGAVVLLIGSAFLGAAVLVGSAFLCCWFVCAGRRHRGKGTNHSPCSPSLQMHPAVPPVDTGNWLGPAAEPFPGARRITVRAPIGTLPPEGAVEPAAASPTRPRRSLVRGPSGTMSSAPPVPHPADGGAYVSAPSRVSILRAERLEPGVLRTEDLPHLYDTGMQPITNLTPVGPALFHSSQNHDRRHRIGSEGSTGADDY